MHLFGGPPVLAGLRNARLDPVAQDVPLKCGEHSQHAGKGPAARRRQIEGLAQGGSELQEAVREFNKGNINKIEPKLLLGVVRKLQRKKHARLDH